MGWLDDFVAGSPGAGDGLLGSMYVRNPLDDGDARAPPPGSQTPASGAMLRMPLPAGAGVPTGGPPAGPALDPTASGGGEGPGPPIR